MGNSEIVPSKLQIFKSQNWVEAGQDQQNVIFSNVNPYRRRLLANVITHQLIEEYQLNFITQEDFNSYLAELTYRQIRPQSQNINSHHFIYPIRYFVNKSKHEMCTTIHTGYLYSDKVELRLKQINDIPFQDLLYMYKATLNGFKLLYEKVGYFDIVQEMIFITKSGRVQVWMNANLAKNYPNYQKTNHISNQSQPALSQRQHQNIYGSQADMIRKLILMIQKNSDQFIDSKQHHPQPQNQLFSQFLQDKNILEKLSFQHSLDEFENYLTRNNFHCPDFMRSIPELFSADQQNAYPINYEFSHVNEITSQHLTQMKRKFQPMQTIIEDENINSKTTQKLRNSYKRENFEESQVATYTPASLSNQRQYNLNKTQNGKVLRPGNGPFMDLGHSKHSYHSNTLAPNENLHLQKSSKSSNNSHPYFIEKPNSVSNLSYNNIQPQQSPLFIKQSQFHPPSPNLMVLSTNPTLINGKLGNPSQFKGPFHNQKIVMISPPPSFRLMNPSSNAYQQTIDRNQSIKLPPPSMVSFKNSHLSSQGFWQLQTKNQINQAQYQKKTFNLKNNREQLNNNVPGTSLNQRKVQNESKDVVKIGSVQPNQKSFKVGSVLSQMKRKQQKNQEKSKIQYFTKNDSYQLDEEIANDLEKFLGLKVN